MVRNYTSVEQSDKLIELGLDSKTADMSYIKNPDGTYSCLNYSPDELNSLLYEEENEYEKSIETISQLSELYDVNGKPVFSIKFLIRKFLKNSVIRGVEIKPCWSVSALLAQMPRMKFGSYSEKFCASVGWHLSEAPYVCKYSDGTGDIMWYFGETPVDACFDMMCWLLDRGWKRTDDVFVDNE